MEPDAAPQMPLQASQAYSPTQEPSPIPPAVEQPLSVYHDPQASIPEAPRPKSRIFPILILLLFFVVLGSAGWYAYTNIYLSPQRIFANAIQKSAIVKTFQYEGAIDISQSSSASRVLVKGSIDNSDPDNPKTATTFTLSGDIFGLSRTSIEVRYIDNAIYANLGPLGALGVFPDKDVTWVKIAPEILGTSTGSNFSYLPTQEDIRELQSQLTDLYQQYPPFIFSRKANSDAIDNEPMYRLPITINKENLQKISESMIETHDGVEASETMKKSITDSLNSVNVKNAEVWIGKKDSLIHKVVVTLVPQEKIVTNPEVTFTLNLKNFNQDQEIVVPENYSDYEDLMDGQLSQARDSQRRADLLGITNALYQYAAEKNGNLPPQFPTQPTCIGTDPECFNLAPHIVPVYIATVPVDPESGTSEHTGYFIYRDQNGRVTATATGEVTPEITITR